MADSQNGDSESSSKEPQPSCFMKSLFANPPNARRPQTINTNNPINPAAAYPSPYVSIDAKENLPQGNIGVRMANLGDTLSTLLASTTHGKPNRYRPRNIITEAEKRQRKVKRAKRKAAKAAKAAKELTKRAVPDLAPHAEGSHSLQWPDEQDIMLKGTGTPEHITPESRQDQRRLVKEGTNFGSKDAGESAGLPPGGRVAEGTKKTRKTKKTKTIIEDSPALRLTTNPSPEPEPNPEVAEVAEVAEENTRAVTTETLDTPVRFPSPITSTTHVHKKRETGMKVPETLAEACEADRMLWEWRNDGKSWSEINTRWTSITGKAPGKSSLSVRFLKLQNNFAKNGGAEDIAILRYKAEAEAQLQPQMWQIVAAKIKENHNVDMTPAEVRRRFNNIKNRAFGVGTDEGTTATTSAADDQPQQHDQPPSPEGDEQQEEQE